MKSVSKKITTNTRVINDLLTKYGDTIKALRELINNSIQAKARTVNLNIEYNDELTDKSPILCVEVIDDGVGVPYSEFDKRILEIGTTVKQKGHGIGRFSALQIGELMHIETVSRDNSINQYSKTIFSLDTADLDNAQFEETEFGVRYEYLDGDLNSYYKVRIEQLHQNKQEKVSKRNMIVEGFLKDNINQTLFENYPFEIFNNDVTFKVNGESLKRDDFVIGDRVCKNTKYVDKNGNLHEMLFYFYNVRSKLNKVKVFFQIENSGVKSVASEFTYSSDWYTPDLGTWFIYIESSILDSDLFRNLDIESLGEQEIKNLKNHAKETINTFFQAKNKRYTKFVNALESDKYYPYSNGYLPSSKLQEVLFKKAAYLIEDDHKLIKENNKIRDFLYPLLDRAISSGYIEEIFKKIMKLSDENLEKFHALLDKTDMEDVVHFASQVSEKLEFLDFLHELTYGNIAKVLKERSQLHKIVEKSLWIFGESYSGNPKLWSDKKIGNILEELRTKFLNYAPSEEDENLIDGVGLDDITDLFFLNEKVTDNGDRGIMVVELKSPKCAISGKELSQIDKYAFALEQNAGLPSNKVKYKLVLISSRLAHYAKSKVKSARDKYDKPFLYDVKVDKDIEVYVMEWSELIELNKRKLGYLSSKLNIKDKSVKVKFEEEYSELIDEKISAQLREIK